MPLADSLAFYYSLSDANAAHGGLNLTNNATVTFVSGKVGNAANFVAASTQYLSHADNALFDMGDIDFTFTCWLQLASKPGASMSAFSKFVTTGNQRSYQMQWNQAADRFLFSMVPDGITAVSVTASSFGVPSLSTWYFIAVRHSASANTVSISINDGTVNSTTVNNGAFASTAPFEIGRLGTGAAYWNGLVDELGCWKRSLSNAEITDLYNGGSGRDYSYISTAGASIVHPLFSEAAIQSAIFGGQIVR